MGVLGERERIAYRAPLALRCADAVSGAAVGDGLSAVAWRGSDPATTYPAVPSPVSSLLGFGGLPGQRPYERAYSTGGDPLNWPDPAAPEPFTVRVTDHARRYLPVTLLAQVPVSAPVEVPLYSAPGRPAPSGWAVVRGELRAADQSAVAWAVVEVAADTVPYTTVSDADGRFLLHLPYPEALPALPGASSAGAGLGAVTWPLTIGVRSEPATLRTPAAPAAPGPPYLDSILGQAAGGIDPGGGAIPTVTETLVFGAPVTLLLTVVSG
ncbi:hypothetical protein OG407_49680 [Streptomyces sp. NBC_01515]|uniref:hypothetical protein n=1 Tax=Streptomyces sp. NBC_01515 TaxID=2903890 RepID=UPI003863428C